MSKIKIAELFTIRGWCLANSKWKKDGFSCEKQVYIIKPIKGIY